MPELPEVETVKRGLEEVLLGETLRRVELRRPNLRFPFPRGFCARLQGERIEALTRRAKYLLLHLSSGEILVIHLGMSGRIAINKPQRDQGAADPKSPMRKVGSTSPAQESRPGQFVHEAGSHGKHDHVIFETGTGIQIVYNDARRFGFMDLIEANAMDRHKIFAHLGPEPLGNQMNAAYLADAAQGRTSDLKAFLMDQRNIAGLGNIYVCEALFRAGVSPLRKAASLASKAGKPLQRAQRLTDAIREVLEDAIEAGGSSLRDYRQTDGSLGYFQHGFEVYGREGEPCVRPGCTGQVLRKSQAGRSTFYCRICQK